MKRLFSTLLLIGLLFPTITEAGFSPEGRNKPKKPRCKGSGGVVVCRMPRKPRKCTIRKPCIPKGYYRQNPPRVIPMGF